MPRARSTKKQSGTTLRGNPLRTVKSMAMEICRREGLKKQVSIAQVLEILGHQADIVAERENGKVEIGTVLHNNGVRRKRRESKTRKG